MAATSPVLRPALKRNKSSESRSRPATPLPADAAAPTSSPGLASPTPLPASVSLLSSAGATSPRYTPKVSFDTFDNNPNDNAMFSFTLQVKSDGYKRLRTTRVFLCAASPDESGSEALDWCLESLVQDGDELVVLRGFDTDDLEKDLHDEIREDAKKLMKNIQSKNVEYDPERKLSIVVEFVAGKVTETIERMIALYRPDALVVGTRGQGGIRTWGAALTGNMGSVSKHCLSRSPVPVIVVRPERKVRKTMEKRRADPKRRTHFDELTRTHTHMPNSPKPQGLPLTSNSTLP